jgi:hypothetical protein
MYGQLSREVEALCYRDAAPWDEDSPSVLVPRDLLFASASGYDA